MCCLGYFLAIHFDAAKRRPDSFSLMPCCFGILKRVASSISEINAILRQRKMIVMMADNRYDANVSRLENNSTYNGAGLLQINFGRSTWKKKVLLLVFNILLYGFKYVKFVYIFCLYKSNCCIAKRTKSHSIWTNERRKNRKIIYLFRTFFYIEILFFFFYVEVFNKMVSLVLQTAASSRSWFRTVVDYKKGNSIIKHSS